jgi:hypothetical protein
MFEDEDGDGEIDGVEIIDDSKNGYIKVSGSYPTCGCECSMTIGAFKDIKGEYTFIEFEERSCSWTKKISSNKQLELLFPDSFGISEFIPDIDENNIEKAVFYLKMEIPRFGTDTKVSIELIPFGINEKSERLMTFQYSENKGYVNCKSLYRIRDMVSEIENETTIDYILSKQFDNIQQNDKQVIEKSIGEDSSRFKSFDELSDYLIGLKEAFDYFNLIENSSVILAWDKTAGRFYIKEKIKTSNSINFINFLKENSYWSPMC